jgi:hypothetical protein
LLEGHDDMVGGPERADAGIVADSAVRYLDLGRLEQLG